MKTKKKISLEAHLNDKLLSLYGIEKKAPSRLNMSWTSFLIKKKNEKHFFFFILFLILRELQAHFFTLCFLAIIDFFFQLLVTFLSLIVFHAIFFLSLVVTVVFQHPLMALSITFHLFIILLTNSHFCIHTFLHYVVVGSFVVFFPFAYRLLLSISQYSLS